MSNNDRQSYVMYLEWEEHMADWTDTERGRFQRFLARYIQSGEEPNFRELSDDSYRAGEMAMAWRMVTAQIDRDAEKWETTRHRRRESGKKGGKARAMAAEAKNEPVPPETVGRCLS